MKLGRFLAFSLVALGLVTVVSTYRQGAANALAASTLTGAEQLPPGVSIETILSGMNNPVAMAFDPQGQLFYTEKTTGNVRLFTNGSLQANPVITYNVSTCSERGLLGIAIDPNFSSNHYIYVYYTQGPGCGATENKVARFVENNGTGSGSVDIFTSPQTAGNHNGGNIHFGPDGKLYVSVGDNANAENAQNMGAKNGKMHRINPDGSIPTDNPRFSQPGGLSSLYAIGLRNSFDFAFDPIVQSRIFASENGPNCDDEMNRIEAGGNYGWRAAYPCDDDSPDPHFNDIAPLWYLGNGACCVAPTGITVYTGSQIPQWRNHIFMVAYNNSALYHFYPNADRTGVTATNIVQGVKANMDIETGPDGALYYMEGGGYQPGTLKRFVGQGGSATTPTSSPVGTPVAVPTVLVPGSGSVTFRETGKTVIGLFLDHWNKNGGLAQQGFPISGVMGEVSDLDGKPYTVQYFERGVFEYHPENQAPYNVLLSQLGTSQYKQKYAANPPPSTPHRESAQYFSETRHYLGGRFLDYWNKHGGLAQQGYPISDEFMEVSDLNGKPYLVQYFERAVFEYHPENQSPYDVLLSQLGTLRYKQKYGGR